MKEWRDKHGILLKKGDLIRFYAYGGQKHEEKILHFKRNGFIQTGGRIGWWVEPESCELVLEVEKNL